MTKGGWRRVGLPDRSVLAKRAHECDHVDSVRFDLEQPITLDAALNLLGAPLSGVMAAAMRVRDVIAGRFGLKTNDAYRTGNPRHPVSCQPGERIGLFTVYERTENEAILGEDDRHLDFRVSVILEETAVTLTTMVFYRSRLGRWYFAVVRPFHMAIIPRSVADNFRKHPAAH